MAEAYEVAKRLIKLAASEEEPDRLTHMRLQKLLYYVQGWSLAVRGVPMFADRIEAWAHGPVVKSVYPKFADFGNENIPAEKIGEPENISDDESELIGSVWESFKGFSASALREMTHAESPWKDARGKCGPADKCDTEITVPALHEFFGALAKS